MKVHPLLLVFVLAVLAHTALSSAYYSNEYFPHTTTKEAVEFWSKKVTLGYLSNNPLSCEAVHL